MGEASYKAQNLRLQTRVTLEVQVEGEQGDAGDVVSALQDRGQVLLGHLQGLQHWVDKYVDTAWLLQH